MVVDAFGSKNEGSTEMSIKSILKKIVKKKYLKNSDPSITIPGTIIHGEPQNVKIGKYVSFGGNVILFANASIEIGDHTMIAMNTVFHTSTHDHNNHPMWLHRIDKPIKVGSHVWIGTNAIILPGVIIEDYAVIGAGAIVTANVPSGAIAVGNPAKIIRYRNIDSIKGTQINCDLYPGTAITQGFAKNYIKERNVQEH